jgi:penicillin-binding protein 2
MRLDYRTLKPYRDYQRNRMLGFRLWIVRGSVVLGFVLFAFVFWFLQIAHGDHYRARAEDNRLRRSVERAVRGVVRDVTGMILVTNRPAFTVYLDRQRTDDPVREVRQLAGILDIESGELLDRVADGAELPTFLPLPVRSDVGLDVAAVIEARRPELPALDVEIDSRRFYPLGTAAAHVIGYLSEATLEEVRRREELLPGDRVGRTGAEAAFDEELRGRPGILLEEINARGRPLRTIQYERNTQHGRAMHLTIDGRMQRDVEEAFAGRSGAAVFLDPRSGAVRALYSGPSFDPNVFSGRMSPDTWAGLIDDPRRPLQNRALAGAYSPGSTFKIVMAVAGLESGAISPEETVYCAGAARFYGQLRRCHFRGGHGWVGLREALARSCNIYFYTIGQRLGIDPIAEWAGRFGLGSRVGFSAGAEVTGLVPSSEWKLRERREPWYPGETISVSIGQGPLMVTPMQMARAVAVVANGGGLVTPYLRERPGGTPPADVLQVSPDTLERVREAMIDVVESERGTARRARVEGVRMAGKTGTAQVVALDADEDPGDHAWFVGFGPADEPELAWAVIVENAGHGGAEAAPVVRTVVERFLARKRDAGDQATVLAARGEP